VIVRYFATIRDLAGESEVVVDDGPVTLGELLSQLAQRHGDSFRGAVFDGAALGAVMVLVNGHNAVFSGGLETPLAAGDEVSLFPPVGGG
jgi:sulfur-carrier protein